MRPSLLVYGQDVGGARILLPVVKRLRRDRAGRVTVLGTEAACEVFHSGGVPCRTLEVAGLGSPIGEGKALRWMASLSPDVYVGDAGHLRDRTAVRLMAACRRLGVPTLALLDHWKNLDRFQDRNGDGFRHAPDILGVMDRATGRVLEHLGLEKDRIRVVGHPYLEEIYRARKRLLAGDWVVSLRRRIGVPREAMLVLCCSEMLHVHGPDVSCTHRCKPLFQNVASGGSALDAVRLAAEQASEWSGRPVVVALRPHPFERRLSAVTSEPRIPLLDDRICSDMEAVAAADVVAGLTAMPLIQAYVLGKPVISLSQLWLIEGARDPSEEFHWDVHRTFIVVRNWRALARTLAGLARARRRAAGLNTRVRTVLRDATGRAVRLVRLMAGRRVGWLGDRPAAAAAECR